MEELLLQELILKHFNNPQDAALTEKVEALRGSSKEIEAYYQETKEIWEKSAETAKLNEINPEVSIKTFRNKLNKNFVSTTKRFNWLRNIAAVFIIAMLTIWLYTENTRVNYIVKETNEQIDSVFLSDGTKVMLASHSTISYPEKFTAEERTISLIKGQAFFNVHKDPSRPFTINIRKSKVYVLGTSFNINYTHAEIDVSVKTGVVKFSPDEKTAPSILSAGQALSYNFIQSSVTIEKNPNANAWLTKELRFVDLPLNQVCNELSEYYHVNIILYDKMQTTKMFNATFTDSSLDEVLTVLEATYQIKISRKDSTIIIKNIHN